MTEAEHDKMLEEKKRNANWGKSISDAQRMEEISRQRAQQQRDRGQTPKEMPKGSVP